MSQFMLPVCEPIACICGHVPEVHQSKESCGGSCSCKKYVPNPNQRVILSVKISAIAYKKFRNLVALRHGLKKGSLSFEVERALWEYLGEKDLDVLMNDKEWKLLNK